MTGPLRIKNLKNGQPYPSAYTYVTHIREPPPRSAVSKLLPMRHHILIGRVQIRKVTIVIAWICKSCKVNIEI